MLYLYCELHFKLEIKAKFIKDRQHYVKETPFAMCRINYDTAVMRANKIQMELASFQILSFDPVCNMITSVKARIQQFATDTASINRQITRNACKIQLRNS